MSQDEIAVELLGPVRLLVGGEPVKFSEKRVLAMLAVLALADELTADHYEVMKHLVGVDRELKSATLRKYASMLRDALGDKARLIGRQKSFTLVVPRIAVDYWRFVDLVDQAGRVEPDRRLEKLRAALDLWRGSRPLTGLGDAHFDDDVRRLDGLRRSALLDLIDVQHGQGLFREAAADAELAGTLWPVDDDVCLLRMRVVAALRRPSDVRHVYDEYVQALAAIGRTPEQDMADHAEQLVEKARTARHEIGPIGTGAPRQLPPVMMKLHGRDRELAKLDSLLEADGVGGRVAALVGTAGVGKTHLALFWAHRAEERFADGVLYADLDGFSTREPKATEQVMAGFVEALGRSAAGIDAEALLSTYRSLLAGKSVLIMLDNAAGAEQVRDLLPAGSESVAVVTSRARLHELRFRSNLTEIVVAPLADEPALVVLAGLIGERRVRADPGAAALVAVCGGLPLALVVAAVQAVRHPRRGLGDLARTLRGATPILDEPSPVASGAEVRTTLAWSYQQLGETASHLFRMIGVHPGPTLELTALLHLAARTEAEVLRGVDELLDQHLLTEVTAERFAAHDVLREYASELASELPQVAREAAYERVLEHLLHAGLAADRALGSGRDLPIGRHPDGMVLPDFLDAEQAADWFEHEYPTFRAVLHGGVAVPSRYRWLLPLVLVTYQLRTGHWTEAEKMLRNALPVASADTTPRHQATVHRVLGNVRRKLGHHSQAAMTIARAIELSREARDSLGEAHGHQVAGVNEEDQRNWTSAVEHYDKAFELYDTLGDVRGKAHVLNGYASHHFDEGRVQKAKETAMRALEIGDERTDPYGRASVLRNLMRFNLRSGEFDRAIEYAESAIAIYRGLRSGANEAQVQLTRAAALRSAARHAEEAEALKRVTTLLRLLKHPRPDDRERLEKAETRLAELRSSRS
ncbi:AfsR/SARP family transcriptional regulator [Saccharothrix australiensis]|nr:BTAD domain-containing putative transcriptional regulator [Saccharothrix australiensis]